MFEDLAKVSSARVADGRYTEAAEIVLAMELKKRPSSACFESVAMSQETFITVSEPLSRRETRRDQTSPSGWYPR